MCRGDPCGHPKQRLYHADGCKGRPYGIGAKRMAVGADDSVGPVETAAAIARADLIEKPPCKARWFFWWGMVDLPHPGHKLRLHRTTQ